MPEAKSVSPQHELLRKVESLTENIERSDASSVPIFGIVDAILGHLRDELGIYGARLYERLGDDYVLQATFPDAQPVEETIRVPRTYEPVELCLMRGSVYMEADDPRLDPEIESALGAAEFAAVEVGSERYMIGFDVLPGYDRESILLSLGVVRRALNQKIREQEMMAIFHQAKLIQASILPKAPPTFGVFDIAGRSDSLDSVGGDLFDYIRIHEGILGLTIADASGHGFPAALQVRDIYMGMRMGMARDLKIVRTVERLNQIIHSSTLTSRFVSMFYGELEITGLFIYVNAGHPPPFHISADGEVTLLREGGPILGPLPTATYDRGFIKLAPGDMLVIYTDGIIEWRNQADPEGGVAEEEYGVARLQKVAKARQGESSEAVIDAIFEDLLRWNDAVQDDDRTVLVVRYPESPTKPD